MYKIGHRVYTLLAIGIILLALIGILVNYQFQKQTIEHKASYQLTKYHKELNSHLEYESKMMHSFLKFISHKEILQKNFTDLNKKELFDNSLELFQQLHTENNITHLYYIKPDGTTFLRVHDYKRDSDIISRYTFEQAKRTQKLAFGVEFGLKKNYTLRVVYPWVVQGELLGYIELGKEIDKIIEHLSKQLNMDIYFAVFKDEYKNSAPFIQERLKPLMNTDKYYIVYQTNDSHPKIIDFLKKDKNAKWLEFNNTLFIGYLDTLQDVSSKELGKTLFLINISREYTELENSFTYYSLIMGSGTFFMLLVGYLFAQRKQKTLDKTLVELVDEKNKVQESVKEKNNLLSLFDKGDSVLFKWNNDATWSINYVSKNVENLLGYTKEEFLSSQVHYSDRIHKDDFEQVLQEVQVATTQHLEFFKHKPYRIITKDNSVKWVLDYTVLQKDSHNNITHFLGYLIDITEQENFRKNLEQFIETQENIVILTNGKEITFANKSFFNFLDYEDLDEFKQDHMCICEHFISNDRFFHLGKVPKDDNWVEYILSLPHSERIVLIMGQDFVPHAFSISINQFNKDLMIISFTDISQTILEHIRLEDKSIHDKLTNAFNREFFEQNYKRLLYEYEKEHSHLALAILDIDHFKDVNDTYGHDVGDIVLVHFVKTIHKFSREHDLLIRWGGEEFVLILQINSYENLHKALEHMRKVIELQNFPTIGQKTCSIGGTIYKEKEDIYTTIKRADEALYEAKNKGRNLVVIK